MRILHTSDWHVGKAIRGHSRADEHRAVLAEMADIAAEADVDLVLVAGDLYETSAPTAESELIVNRALLALAEVAPVLVVSGNHDSPRRFDAVSPLLELGRIQVATVPRAPADGGVVNVDVKGGPIRVAMVPFVSQRAIVRARDLMDAAAYENAQSYGDRMHRVVAALSAPFTADAVNIIMAHAFVLGGQAGGGERPAHLVEDYALSSLDFPPTASYVALGHLHRAQKIPGPTAIHYCGSPLQLDFGEEAEAKQVNLIDVEPGLPAKVEARPLRSGRPLRTLAGTLAELEVAAAALGRDEGADDDRRPWLRVRVAEAARAGLAETVRELFGPGVVDVRIERTDDPTRHRRPDRTGRSAAELFGDYLTEAGVADPRIEKRFSDLYEDLYEDLHEDLHEEPNREPRR